MDEKQQSFTDFCPTPEIRKQSVKKATIPVGLRDLFSVCSSKQTAPENMSRKKTDIKSRKTDVNESWCCFVCQEDHALHMHLCVLCNRYVPKNIFPNSLVSMIKFYLFLTKIVVAKIC